MEFYLSPESERAIMQARDQRQRQFDALASQVNEQNALRLLEAHQHSPASSLELSQAYAMTPDMTLEQFEQLAMEEERIHARQSRSLIGKVGDVVHDTWFGAYHQIVQPTLRTAFLAVDTLAQEVVQRPATAAMSLVTGDADSFGQAYQDYGSSTGVVAATQFARGEGFDIGRGILLGGRAAEESERQRKLTIKGARADMGTGMAALSVNNLGLGPGDKAFDTSAAAYQFFADVALDPTAWATSGATGAVRASKGIVGGHRTLGSAVRAVSPKMGNEARAAAETAGLVNGGHRSTVLVEKAEHLFKNPKLLDQLASANEYEIARRFKLDRMGARKESLRELILDLGGASTREQVSDILIDAVQRGHIRERGFYSGAGQYLRNPKETWRDFRLDKNLPEMRYGGINPARTVSAAQPMDAASEIDNMLRLAKVPEAERMAIFNRSIRAESNDQLLHIVDDAARAVGRRMEDIGVKADDVDALLKARRKEMNAMRSYLLDENGQQAMPPWKKKPTVTIEGIDQAVDVPSASLLTHLNDSAIPLFDPQDLRRATAKLSGVRAVYQSAGWEMGEHVVRAANRWAFKFPTLFTRAAYTVRNNLDNLARVAGAGYDSIFTNPRAWMAMGVGGRGKFRDVVIDGTKTLRPGGEFRLADGMYGRIDDIADGFATGTMHGAGGVDKPFRMAVDELQPQVTSTARSFDEVARETGTLTQNASGMWDSTAGRKLGAYRTYTNGVDDEFVTAWRGELGKHLNNEISRAVADSGRWATRDDLVNHLIDSGAIAKMKAFGAEATEFFYPQGGLTPSRQAVSQYIDFVEDSIQTLTGGNQQLRSMIHTGNLNGVNFNDLRKNKRINQILREQYLETAAPQQVSGSVMLRDGKTAKDQWAHFTQSWVDIMASRPENHFTRYPLMTQVFADDIARAMPSLADDAARIKLVQAMADAGFDDKRFAHIAQAAQDAAGQRGVVTRIEDVIDAAKLHSADQTLNIAFDATRRSSFQEAFDAYTPFWDAFLEVGGSWGRIIRDNPNVFVRGFSGYDSLRSSGQFFVDEHGQEVFGYPGGGLLARALGIEDGRPSFEGRVAGLNLIVQGIGPGFGPLVSWATGAFLPDEPDNQWIRDIVTPFGSRVEKPSDLADPSKIAVDLMPAWLQKATNAWTEGDIDPHAWNSAVGDVMTVLATSGAYDMSNPDQLRQLERDAERGARWTMFVRSAIQWGAPTGPGVQWEIETDPDGTHHRIATMAGAYFEILEAAGGDHQAATVEFIGLYGVEPFWISQGKTKQLVRGPRTREGWDWMGRNKEFAEKHSNVAGYFVPAEDPSAPPDYNVWQQRLRSGEIQSLTGEQQLALANKTKAYAILEANRRRVEHLPRAAQQDHLRQVRAFLTDQFPGWDSDVIGVGSRLSDEEQIRQLERAAFDPAAEVSPVTEPLRVYLTKRQEVYAELQRRADAGGARTLSAEANADLADFMRGIGQELSVRSPHFRGVWTTLLSREID